MSHALADDTTQCLSRWSQGCPDCGEELLRRVYPDLRRLARDHRLRLPSGDSTSDYVQELCLRLFEQRSVQWRNRGHFFAIAAKLMRRLAVDQGRRASSLKRGGALERVQLDDLPQPPSDIHVLALDQALTTLARSSPATVKVVELRYFAGLSVEETAAVMGVGRATVLRRWRFARAWLTAKLSPTGAAPRAG